MPNCSFLLFAILLPLAGYARAGLAEAPADKTRHLAGSQCALCHVAGAGATEDNAWLLAADEKKLCAPCHEKSIRVSHRSGFVPERRLPNIYPLTRKGEVSCSTCHHPHGRGKLMIRGERVGKEFCFSCHSRDFFKYMSSGGVRISLSGHDSSSREFLQRDLDEKSIVCLRCHLGLEGRLAIYVEPTMVARHNTDDQFEHPIGGEYKSRPDLRPNLKPVERLSPRIQMVQGRLGCISCHAEGEGKGHGKLVSPMKKSRLCKECHDY